MRSMQSGDLISIAVNPAADIPKHLNAHCREQAYTLSIRDDRIHIAARARTGAYYALQTLDQIVEQTADGNKLPAIEVTDYPSLEWRGLQYDLARGMTYRHDHLKDVVRNMAALKLNMLHLYLEGRFAYPSHPELHQDGWMTPDQARDLCAFAHKHHVTIVPQVNCLGHMEQILNVDELAHLREDPDDIHMICPSNPDALPFVLTLVDDLLDAFETPFIHFGMDEVQKLGFCPDCAERIRTDGHAGALVTSYINAISEHVRDRNRRAMIWSDMFLDKAQFPATHAANGGVTGWGSRNMTAKGLPAIDRSVIICDWQYAYFSPREIKLFRELGFDVLCAIDSDERGCPWGPVEGLDTHIRNMYEAARQEGALGGYTCTWGLRMGEVFDNRWLDFAKSAETLWSRRSFDTDEIGARFSAVFLGMRDNLVPQLDAGIKRDVLPKSMRLVPNLLNLERPWAILEPPRGTNQPVTPLGDPHALMSAKEQLLITWRKARATASLRPHLLQCMDIPLLVDALAMHLFCLKASIRAAYAYAEQNADDPLVQDWCRESLEAAVSSVLSDVRHLRQRLRAAYETYGNDHTDVQKAQQGVDILEECLRQLTATASLPRVEDWCPAPLRPD
jgi:hypothetical protein